MNRTQALSTRRAYSTLELLVTLALLGLLASFVLPLTRRVATRLEVRLAAGEVAGVLRRSRIFAIQHRENVAVRFYAPAGRRQPYTYALFRDGDGDGVRNNDIQSGVDPELQSKRPLSHLGSIVTFSIPTRLRPTEPFSNRLLSRLDDPIRFNRSDLASFDPLGGATPGTVYISDGRDSLAAVRVSNRSGRVRVLVYDARARTWRTD